MSSASASLALRGYLVSDLVTCASRTIKANDASCLLGSFLETAGGAIAEPQYPSCFPLEHRKAPFQVAALHQWTNPRDDEMQKQSAENWVHEVLKDEQCGPFPCFLSSGEKGVRVRNVYGEENFEKLKMLKRKYDPHYLLKHTHFEEALSS